jgi:hypothetical protein
MMHSRLCLSKVLLRRLGLMSARPTHTAKCNRLGLKHCVACGSRLPLGVPSRLMRRALELARSLIKKPGSQGAAGQGVEREAGYIVLSALCVSIPPETTSVSLCTHTMTVCHWRLLSIVIF